MLALEDGTIYSGYGIGAEGLIVGEICFNTSMTGYQEIISDPSYAGQIITFTFPHVGNVGTNKEDLESLSPAVRGIVLNANISDPSNWRANSHLDSWLKANGIVGITGVDTRRLTKHIRSNSAQNGAISFQSSKELNNALAIEKARNWPGLKGMDLAKDVTCKESYTWKETEWTFNTDPPAYKELTQPKFRVVAMDFGAKYNILRSLASRHCEVIVVPASTSVKEIQQYQPDGIFLSNGPGDPVATNQYAGPIIRALIKSEKPLFGICLGHQLLSLALGAQTRKMPFGHRGANHPVKDLDKGTVEITSQNHGFDVIADTLPAGVKATHISLFDGTLEGIKVENKPIFSVQYHPEASPGPQDSGYLFDHFIHLMESHK